MNSPLFDRDIHDRISQAIAARYAARTVAREARLAEAKRVGPIAAAPRAEALARTAHLTPIEGRNLEATSGNYDIDQVNFLSRGLKAARPVCRITAAGSSWGTGFLVAPGLLITNNHVLPDAESAAGCNAEFNYEYDADDNPLKRMTWRLAPDTVFVTSPAEELDFTLVALDDPAGVSKSLGWLPLDPRENKIVAGEPAVCIEHPGQEDKKVCLFDSVLVDKIANPDEPYLHYTTDTDRGASGSPIFNRNWQVIALHHGSFTHRETDAQGTSRDVVVNEGIRISRLLTGLRTGNGITVGDEALRGKVLSCLLAPTTLGDSRPQGPAPSFGSNAAPGVITGVMDTTASSASRPLLPEGARTVVKKPPLSHYIGRKGYQENFLGEGALKVPLPTLARALRGDVAPLLECNAKHVLKYAHYSVVLSASRRVAYFSASNIDGATNPAAFDRKKRLVIEFESTRDLDLEQAADRWYYDPRIAMEYQIGPELFDDAKTRFDFGHITRRMDVVWGATEAEMLLGSDDSFHMTNCSPQVSSYNQHGEWGSLEDAIAKFARGGGGEAPRKVSVISGPVLHPSDPELLGVQVPLSFWKVVAFVEGGQLRALAFLTTQRELVETERLKLESTQLMAKTAFANEWLCTVRDVSRLTSLNFGPLLSADYLAGRGTRKRPITAALLNELFG